MNTPHSNTFERRRSSKSRWIEGGLIFGFWAFLFVLDVAQEAFDFRGQGGITPNDLQRSALEYLLWLLVTPGIFWLTSRYTFDRGTFRHDLGIHLLAVIIVTIAMQAYSHFSFLHFIWDGRRPSLAFLDSLTAFLFIDELMIYLFVAAVGFARNYFFRYRKHLEETVHLREDAALLQTQLAEARLQALRMQLNPHFLFNTLNTVSVLVEKNPKGVRKMISLLSDLLRYTLEDENMTEVPLHQELKFLRSYFQIQEIRFQGKLEFKEEIEESVEQALVPSLILQPLAENAIKHGVSRLVGQGRILLKIWRVGKILYLSIRDNGPGLGTSNENGTGIGLRNTRGRLTEIYGDQASLVIETADEGGVAATISLPYHTQDDFVSAQ